MLKLYHAVQKYLDEEPVVKPLALLLKYYLKVRSLLSIDRRTPAIHPAIHSGVRLAYNSNSG